MVFNHKSVEGLFKLAQVDGVKCYAEINIDRTLKTEWEKMSKTGKFSPKNFYAYCY